ncbi:MAG: Carbon-nitrogen hydrolase [Aureobasidium pullulans]|nr:MAG: Carbon-nitrogen hydrolase [Aureobasidium pullulans]
MVVSNLDCTSGDVGLAIKAVLKADLLSGRKRDELIALSSAGKGVLSEVADVINMELQNLGDWSWKPSPTPAQMRKQINGKYRVYMDPEIHQALLLEYLGVRFAVHTKQQFESFFRSNAWPKSAHHTMSSRDHARAAFYLSRKPSFNESLLYRRREQFKDDFFLTQLPSSIQEGNRDYNAPDDSDEEDSEKKSPLEVKQTLLRLATTELMVQRKIYGSFTLCQTDFKWFVLGH